jgi:hypothetical protein
MGKINWARVLLGGLLAGFVINIFEYVTNGVVLGCGNEGSRSALIHGHGSCLHYRGLHRRNRSDLAICGCPPTVRCRS